MKSVRKFAVITLLLCGMSVASNAQDRPTHELHSMMIYNFLKYVQWPGELNTGEFVIGVIGDDDVYNTLNTWYGNKTRGDKTLIVKKYSDVNEIGSPQLLYIGGKAANNFEAIKTKLSGKSTLTVTDKSGLGQKGSCINFKVVDNRLKFELNQAAVDANNLKVSSQLTSMAILI